MGETADSRGVCKLMPTDCLGWNKTMKNCGRNQQVVPPGSTCPNVDWFYLGLAVVVGMAMMGVGRRA